jgi:hypothetical protein
MKSNLKKRWHLHLDFVIYFKGEVVNLSIIRKLPNQKLGRLTTTNLEPVHVYQLMVANKAEMLSNPPLLHSLIHL